MASKQSRSLSVSIYIRVLSKIHTYVHRLFISAMFDEKRQEVDNTRDLVNAKHLSRMENEKSIDNLMRRDRSVQWNKNSFEFSLLCFILHFMDKDEMMKMRQCPKK